MYHFPPASCEAYVDVWLSESVNCTEPVSVKTGPSPVVPPTSTVTGPVEAPAGTTTVIEVSLQLVTVAGTVSNVAVLLLWVAPNPAPLIVTVEPTIPEGGE